MSNDVNKNEVINSSTSDNEIRCAFCDGIIDEFQIDNAKQYQERQIHIDCYYAESGETPFDLSFTADQEKALNNIREWYKDSAKSENEL